MTGCELKPDRAFIGGKVDQGIDLQPANPSIGPAIDHGELGALRSNENEIGDAGDLRGCGDGDTEGHGDVEAVKPGRAFLGDHEERKQVVPCGGGLG